jgi:PPM family protein phosphatase
LVSGRAGEPEVNSLQVAMTEYVPGAFVIDVAVLTDAGTCRARNEDHCGKVIQSKTSGLIAVADGLTSVEGGDLASERAVSTLVRSFRELSRSLQQTERLVRAVRSANYEIRETALTVPQLSGMSTTLTTVAVTEGLMSAAHVGNGRVYLIRDGDIVQLSKDHTLAAETGCPGEHGDRLTRQLGPELIIPVDLFEIHLFEHDVVVICTDGLHRILSDEQIVAHAIVGNATTTCHRLIEQANLLGTPDNLSAGVVKVVGPSMR